MPWFISTFAHQQIVATLEAQAAAFKSAWEQSEARHEATLSLLRVKEQPRSPDRQEGDPLTEVIRARAGNNGAVRRALGQYVKTARAQGLAEDVILQQVTDWPSSDDEGVE